jgi:hypothetical protein
LKKKNKKIKNKFKKKKNKKKKKKKKLNYLVALTDIMRHIIFSSFILPYQYKHGLRIRLLLLFQTGHLLMSMRLSPLTKYGCVTTAILHKGCAHPLSLSYEIIHTSFKKHVCQSYLFLDICQFNKLN